MAKREYSPYKMKGHTLPGINQRSDAKATNVAELGLASSSPFQHKAFGSPHPINPQGVEQQPGAGHPNTARAHNVKKDKKSSPGKWVQAVAALAPLVMNMINKKKEEKEEK